MPHVSTVSCIFHDFKFTVLLDTGAAVSHISLKLARDLKLEIDYTKPEVMMCANGTPMQTIGTAFLTLLFGKIEVSHVYRVEKDVQMALIMGRDILRTYKIMMDHDLDTFWFKEQPWKVFTFTSGSRSIIFSMEPRPYDMERFGYKCDLENLIESFPTVCRKDGQIGQTQVLMHEIRLDTSVKDYNKPIQARRNYFPPVLQAEVERQVQDLLKYNKIRRSSSAYRFSIALDQKKDGSIRLAVNYRQLNKRTLDNATPIHNSNIILRLLPTGGIFTSLDLNSSFWQVQLHPDSRHLTAFEANGVLYEWNVMPFGLKGAPATFVSLMNFVLSGLIMKICFVYMDDTIVFSRKHEQHLKDVEQVLVRFRQANLTVNLKKSTFAATTLEYLGHIISSDGIRKNPAKVRALVEMPPPRDKEGVKRLQGFFSWVITFVPNFSSIFEPISRVAKKDARFVWGTPQQGAFDKLKVILSKDIVLHGINYRFEIFVKTDACEYGIGFYMYQIIDGKEVVVFYGSATLTDSQRLWNICEKECFSIVVAIVKCSPFLQGQKFTVYTDNIALTNLKAIHDKSKRLTKFSSFIENWQCVIKHIPGSKNKIADCLSRAPVATEAKEIDHLESPEQIYTPVFSLTFMNHINVLLKQKQRVDEECKKIYAELRGGRCTTALAQKYITKDGILCRKRLSSHILHDRVEQSKEKSKSKEAFEAIPMVPVSLREDVLKQFHDTPESAHFGIYKTGEAIKRRFFWNNMNREIKKYVYSCTYCQKYKGENQKPKGLMGFVPIPDSVAETWCIDFIGPLPTSKKRNKHCLVMVDQLSGWVELKAMPVTTTKRVIDFLEETFCRFGSPLKLVSDNASYFKSKAMRIFLRDWNVKQKCISPYHPQVNPSERVNKDLVRMIATFAEEQHNSWDEHLNSFALALRSQISKPRKMTPSMVMMGRQLKLPIDRALQQKPSEDYEADREKMLEFPTSMNQIFEFVKAQMRQAQEANKVYYDEKRRPFEFEVGDLVLVRNHQKSDATEGIAKKLLQKWIGPFKVISKNESNYVLNMGKGFVPKRHISDLKPYHERKQTPRREPWSLKKIQTGLEPDINPEMQLRPRKNINYRVLAGHKEKPKQK